MILIFSEQQDVSTNKVMDWLKFHFNQTEILRINSDDSLSNIFLEQIDEHQRVTFLIAGKIVKMDEVKFVWFRRGSFKLNFDNIDCHHKYYFNNEMNHYLNYENVRVTEYINSMLQEKKSIGNFYMQNMNKMYVLDKAKKVGILVPNTIITTSKTELKTFLEKYKHIVTKPMSVSVNLTTKNITYLCYTKSINNVIVREISEQFFPSLFQEQLDKKYEIRTFYIRGEFYSMAIFSQLDERTKVDFRNYNYKKPNRCVPFKLPNELEVKIDTLMKFLNLDTGSIDIVVNKKGEYYFLEVNPVGQFDMISVPCNYPIEKRLAETMFLK
jgi:ATP-GRASP peptide maturase of grasp-with-spasm system